MLEAAGGRVISPRNAPPATTVYHKSESALGGASDGVSNVTGCPKTWDSTVCVLVAQASNHAFNSGLSCFRAASVTNHLPGLGWVPERVHERHGENSRALASPNISALRPPPARPSR